MSTARDEILSRIRDALRDVPADESPDAVPVPRDYEQVSSATATERVEQLVDRLTDYKASVRIVNPAELPGAIASACAARAVRRLVVPADLPEEWVPPDVEVLSDPGLSNEELNTSDGVLTACALAIAQTGTIVLDSGPGQGRRAITLLPDYHLCIVREEQIVGLVPEAMTRLHNAASGPGRPMTWISGPSATSDIELSRVEGVHGPRTLEVLIVVQGDG